MKRESFIFYRSFYEAICELPENNQLELYNAILLYSLEFKEPKLTGISRTIWILIKPQIDANNKRYINGCKGSVHGNKGGRPLKIKTPKQTPNKTPKKPLSNKPKTPNDNVNVNDNELYTQLKSFVSEYGKDMIREFYDYWSEPNKKGKLKYELERTWDLSRRLKRWSGNNFGKKETPTLFNGIKYLTDDERNKKGLNHKRKYVWSNADGMEYAGLMDDEEKKKAGFKENQVVTINCNVL